jgi:hypothetical protein
MTTSNVLRVRRRRQRLPAEPRLGAKEPLLVSGGLLTLLLIWGLLGPGWAVLVAVIVALWAGLALWARGGSHTLHPTERHPQAPDYERRALRLGLLDAAARACLAACSLRAERAI